MTAAPRPTRIVVVTGAPGAGKTETGRRLVRRYNLPAALIDTDTVADIYPWNADERLYAVLGRNLRSCLAAYRDWGARVVVVSGVLLPGRSLDQFRDLLDDPSLEWVFYGLRAGPDELAARIRTDPKVQDAGGRLAWSHLDGEVPSVPGVRLIDTRTRTVDEVTDLIATREAAELGPGAVTAGVTRPFHAARPPVPDAAVPVRTTRVPAPDGPVPPRGDGHPGVLWVEPAEAVRVCRTALVRLGFPAKTAETTAVDLVAAETHGMPSHGLLRVAEYAAAIDAGHLDPTAEPVVTRTGAGAWLVDGRHAPGVVVRRSLTDTLARADTGGPVAVGLRA
ncbi:Ldh family oxidoreductase, partial [Streptomyces olivaceoviridis]